MLFDTLTVSAFTTLAKVMGAAKALALARVFGSSAALDSYLLAFLAPSFLADVFCGSLVPVLVPALVEFEYREGEAKAVDLYAQVLWRCLSLASVGAAILAAVASVIATLDAGSRINLRLLGVLTLLMTPILPLAAVANVWRAVLNSRRSFVIPALTVTYASGDYFLHFDGWNNLWRVSPGRRNESGLTRGSRGAWLGASPSRISDPATPTRG